MLKEALVQILPAVVITVLVVGAVLSLEESRWQKTSNEWHRAGWRIASVLCWILALVAVYFTARQ